MLARIQTYLEMIRFSHTVFALPFAGLGAILAADGLPPWGTLGWILAAMVGARSGAMGFNRIADRHLDALNPRTAERALPRGRISLPAAAAFTALAFGLLLLAAWRLNPLCLALAPLAILWVCGYSYTKRFTALSHVVLGASLALAPIGAWIAVRGEVAAAPLLLGGAVLFWVAGFDILYALTDIEFDRRVGLHSVPARLGTGRSLVVAAAFHLLTLAGLAALAPLLGLGLLYLLGVGGAACLLVYEHGLVHRHGLGRLDTAFFNANGLLSVGLFLCTLADRLA